MKCLVSRCRCKAQRHHFPVKKADGGQLTVPLCDHHHRCLHREHPDLIILTEVYRKAPAWWIKHGCWKQETWEIYYESLYAWKKSLGIEDCWLGDPGKPKLAMCL